MYEIRLRFGKCMAKAVTESVATAMATAGLPSSCVEYRTSLAMPIATAVAAATNFRSDPYKN